MSHKMLRQKSQGHVVDLLQMQKDAAEGKVGHTLSSLLCYFSFIFLLPVDSFLSIVPLSHPALTLGAAGGRTRSAKDGP
jgi:hypothetical protein